MKKRKVIVTILIILIVIFILDFISIFIINRPLLALKDNNVYKGLFYNVYNCDEYAVPQIKLKNTKFTCVATDIDINKKVIEIVDTTTTIKDFSCAEMLEQFYEDEKFAYYFSCLKNDYILVKYNDGSSEIVEESLRNGNIVITDLDKYNIKYYAFDKKEIK